MSGNVAFDPRLVVLLLLMAAAACSGKSLQPSAANAAGASGQIAPAGAAGMLAAGSGAGPAGSPAAGRPASAGAGAGTVAGRAGAGPAAGSGDDDAGVAAQPMAGSAGAAPVMPQGPATGPFPPVSDFKANGPFKAAMMAGAGPNNNFTIHLPDELAKGGVKNPVVTWISGGGTNQSLYPLLPLLATHGFVVLASDTIPGIGAEIDLGKEQTAALDWAVMENTRQGSPFFGKLDTGKLAAMGYSMGSLATFTMAADPRLTTTVHISGGNMIAERVNNLRAPAAFFCGIPSPSCGNILAAECDIAAANCDTDFAMAKTPVFYGNFSGGHLGILTPPTQEIIQAETVAWLRWQLMADTTLKARFVGPDCGVCKDSNWKVQQKNLQ